MLTIGHIVEEAEWIDEQVKNKEVNQKFVQQPSLRGIVIVKDHTPIGHIPRAHFYQKIGTLYGYNLYMGRANILLAKTNPLIVDAEVSLADASKLAMRRNEEDLYDDLIVTEKNCFIGIVSVRTLLLKLAEAEISRASALNPLSGLPGNQMIDQKINDLWNKEKFSLIYIDVDRFKIFNDLYGFNRGDKVLLYLTMILKRCVVSPNDFLGHIGGDDFVIIAPHFDVTALCESIIWHFKENIHTYYDEAHLMNPPVVKDRNGQDILLEPMKLSIAVVSNEFQAFSNDCELSHAVAQVKKQCKMQETNCIIFYNPALAM